MVTSVRGKGSDSVVRDVIIVMSFVCFHIWVCVHVVLLHFFSIVLPSPDSSFVQWVV